MRGRNRLSSRDTTAGSHAEFVTGRAAAGKRALCLRRPGSVVEVRDTPHGPSLFRAQVFEPVNSSGRAKSMGMVF